MGVPTRITWYMLSTIQCMVFYLHTAYGDSKVSYSSQTFPSGVDNIQDVLEMAPQPKHPFQGICQGNGGGPAGFLSVSAPCIDFLQEQGHITHFHTALSGNTFSLVGLVYVDDMDLIAVADGPNITMEDISDQMQEKVLCWSGSTRVTGGSQKITKCSWTPIDFTWDEQGNWHYREDYASNICIPDDSGTLWWIAWKSPMESTMVIGVEQSLDGLMSAQVTALTEKANDIGNRIRTGHLPQ